MTAYWSRPLAALALVLSAGVLSACNDDESPQGQDSIGNGPVEFEGAQVVQSAGIRARGGQKVVFGATVISNTGSQVATLRTGDLVGTVDDADASLEMVRVIDLSHGGDLVGAAIWPYQRFDETSQPVDGFSLGPGDEAELLYVINIGQTGEWFWPQSALDYVVGGSNFRAQSNFGFRICPPQPASCDDD